MDIYVQNCPQTLVEALITLMVHPSYISKVNFKTEPKNENYFEKLGTKILESSQKILPQGCENRLNEKSTVLQTVVDILLKKCPKMLREV